MSRTPAIVGCFALFLLSVAIFAAIYYILYRRRPDRFLFGAEIRQAQRVAFITDAAGEVSRLEATMEALDYWASQLEAGAKAWALSDRSSPTTLPSGRQTAVRRWTKPAGVTGMYIDKYICAVSTSDGTPLVQVDLPITLLKEEFAATTHRDDQRTRAAKLAVLQARLETVTPESPFVWSFLDFLYFSTITQTTVGYGDILPNATGIRIIVLVQILVGYAILIVLLNVVLSGGAA